MGSKLKFVLSDLHLGAGCTAETGNPLEDFAADSQLADFLQQIVLESDRDQREVELIINGDFLEFLQVPAVDKFDPQLVYPKTAYLDSSEKASLKRLNLIIKGHPQVFNALSDFMHVSQPQRRITLIKGNHDVNLYWPRVKSRLREAMGASGARSSLLLFAEEFVSREKIYVEHGHQRAEKMNSYHDFLDPRHPTAPLELYYPPGSHFVINCLNDMEHRHPVADKVKPLTSLLWAALPWDFEFAAQLLAGFIRHTPGLVVSNFSLDDTPFPANSLLHKLEDPQLRQAMAVSYSDDLTFRRKLHRQIQQYLDDANIAYKSDHIAAVAENAADDPLVMGQTEQVQQRFWLREAALDIARQERASIIIFSHSHQPVFEKLPTGHIYINTGSWTPSYDIAAISPPTAAAVLFDNLSAGVVPPQLPYARIDYTDDRYPCAQLLDFAADNRTIVTNPITPANILSKLFSRLTAPFKPGSPADNQPRTTGL